MFRWGPEKKNCVNVMIPNAIIGTERVNKLIKMRNLETLQEDFVVWVLPSTKVGSSSLSCFRPFAGSISQLARGGSTREGIFFYIAIVRRTSNWFRNLMLGFAHTRLGTFLLSAFKRRDKCRLWVLWFAKWWYFDEIWVCSGQSC